jgi:hypothetical protein
LETIKIQPVRGSWAKRAIFSTGRRADRYGKNKRSLNILSSALMLGWLLTGCSVSHRVAPSAAVTPEPASAASLKIKRCKAKTGLGISIQKDLYEPLIALTGSAITDFAKGIGMAPEEILMPGFSYLIDRPSLGQEGGYEVDIYLTVAGGGWIPIRETTNVELCSGESLLSTHSIEMDTQGGDFNFSQKLDHQQEVTVTVSLRSAILAATDWAERQAANNHPWKIGNSHPEVTNLSNGMLNPALEEKINAVLSGFGSHYRVYRYNQSYHPSAGIVRLYVEDNSLPPPSSGRDRSASFYLLLHKVDARTFKILRVQGEQQDSPSAAILPTPTFYVVPVGERRPIAITNPSADILKSDIRIAMIDTGIGRFNEIERKDIDSIYALNPFYYARTDDVYDADKHGTDMLNTMGRIFNASESGKGFVIYMLKFIPGGRDSERDWATDAFAAGLRWAAKVNARVVNLSLVTSPGLWEQLLQQSPEKIQETQEAYDELGDRAIIVAAAGNTASGELTPPALWGKNIVVGSTQPNSNYNEKVDFYVKVEDNEQTSHATAITSAIIAGMLDVNPNLDREQIREILRSFATTEAHYDPATGKLEQFFALTGELKNVLYPNDVKGVIFRASGN